MEKGEIVKLASFGFDEGPILIVCNTTQGAAKLLGSRTYS